MKTLKNWLIPFVIILTMIGGTTIANMDGELPTGVTTVQPQSGNPYWIGSYEGTTIYAEAPSCDGMLLDEQVYCCQCHDPSWGFGHSEGCGHYWAVSSGDVMMDWETSGR